MGRPLLLEGEPGTGKTALAEALAEGLGGRLVRLQCYEGIDAAQALYDWDFPRQVLHLRAVEAGRRRDEDLDVAEVESPCSTSGSCSRGPMLRALRRARAVLLVDEIDRADDEFEAFLLEVLSTNAVTIPELGTVTAATPPLVVLTSNRTREVHDALKRRCLYHWVEHPGLDREVADRAPPAARGARRGWPSRWRARSGLRDGAAGRRRRPAQAARRRRDARLGARPCIALGTVRARRRDRRRHPRRRVQVPRGHRAGAATPSTGCWPGDRVTPPVTSP